MEGKFDPLSSNSLRRNFPSTGEYRTNFMEDLPGKKMVRIQDEFKAPMGRPTSTFAAWLSKLPTGQIRRKGGRTEQFGKGDVYYVASIDGANGPGGESRNSMIHS